MRAALVSRDGKVSARSDCDTEPESGIDDAARRLGDLLVNAREAAGDAPVAGVGVSTAGPLDPSTGVYNHPPNLTGWHGHSLKPGLEKILGVPVAIGHDATLAALAETRFGPHRGAQNLLYVTVSTGVGGGIIANGQMVTGANGGAGEVGHITVRPGGQSCNVGCDGCFEGNASGTAIPRLAAAAVSDGRPSAMLDMAGGDPKKITARIVFDAADDGDAVAVEVRDLVITNIGIGIGGLLNIFDPEALILGGGVIDGLRNHWDKVEEAVRGHSLPRYREGVPIHVTTLGGDVSLLGAAELAFRNAAAG